GFFVNAVSPASANGVMATVCALLALAGGAVVVARAHRSPVGAVVGSLGTVVLFGLLGRTAPVVLAPPSWGVVFGTLLFFRARQLHALYQTSPFRAFQAAAGEALAVGFVIVLVGGLAATAVSPEGFALRRIEREPMPFRAPVLPPPLPVERPDSAALGDLRRGLDAGKALFERGRYRDASTAFRGVDRDWRPLAARYPDDLELKQIGAEDRRWQKKVHDACEAEREVALRRGAEPPTCT